MYYTQHEEDFGFKQCVYIFSNLELNSNGDVSLCRDYNDYIIGNIKSQSLKEIWNSELAINFRKSLSENGVMPVCRRCCGLMGF